MILAMKKQLKRLSIVTISLMMAFTVGCVHPHAMDQAELYFHHKDYGQAFKTLYPLAVSGHAHAQYAIGYMYYYGKGTGKDTDVARTWIERAAARDCTHARHALEILTRAETRQYTPLQDLPTVPHY